MLYSFRFFFNAGVKKAAESESLEEENAIKTIVENHPETHFRNIFSSSVKPELSKNV